MGGHKLVKILQSAVADPGEGPGGPGPPLFLEKKTEAGRDEKMFWRPPRPPPLPLYRKVWIRQCSVKLYNSCLRFG